MTDNQTNSEPLHPLTGVLWSDLHKTRQFLIPETCQLPPGDFLLSTATGREWRVDPVALAKFEISDEEAKAWLKEQLRCVMKKLGTGMRETQSPEASLSGETKESNKPGVSDDQQKSSATPGLDLLADITGTPRESLNTDYAAVGGALRSYLENMIGTTSDAVSGEPDRMDAARERMRQWSEILREHGIATPVSPVPADNTSAQTQDTPPESSLSETSELIPETKKKASFSDRLRELAEDFRSRADALAAAREGKIPKPAPIDDKNVSRSKNVDSTPMKDLSTEDALKAAEALESTAQSIESTAGDTAKWLRDLAARLQPAPESQGKPKSDADKKT